VFGVDGRLLGEQRELATADSRTLFISNAKEIRMITSKPVELGRVSEETKQFGPSPPDSIGSPVGEQTA